MNILEEEKIAYMANIISIALKDGILSPKEISALEEFRNIYGLKKAHYTSAYKVAENPSFRLVYIGNFGVQVNNLSDMLYLAHIDGEFSGDESNELENYSKNIGLTKEQFSKMIKEAESASDSFKSQIECPKCKTTNESTAKFCKNCGFQLTNSSPDPIKIEFEIPKEGYSIEFSESTSSNFPLVLQIAKSAPIFESALRNKKNWYLASWPKSDFGNVFKLASGLSGLKNKRFYINGTEELWDTSFGFLWCFNNRNQAYQPDLYCFGKEDNRINPWGCTQIRMDWTEWADWFSYGKFIPTSKNSYQWKFDKERIMHEVNQNLHRVRMCPSIKFNFIQAILDHLPDVIDLENNKDWDYKTSFSESPGAIKIVEKGGSGFFKYENAYYSDGVKPKGFNFLKTLIEKSAKSSKEALPSIEHIIG
ncbi:zinc ribbon domain-containing protein (plasmid) [Leptospira interrogans]|uniref:zinc ribbon domain-containing protein n=1 Tax=Leptospira TaxID=171 RepID=UPI0002923B45|nr:MULTISPECIES: zinc ribbon domain-containing protein [Leptospira]EKO04919.1 zinc-ribbon domain protein [Leptospira interrogans str. C10069]EMN61448.1 zinc-ribbon domain protein [Leptospira interrogans serovar Pyrogenes str. R168]ULG86604.1 zinc ribbon domain-containing protein [Leptospira interrogans]ULG86620.1 zinc ribbon domain-containing protein [Leptospira interrogans]ULG90626.1 zinc ribbon domain-containing protein [Leptospira interrogans]